ncbi:hypothetical protein A5784_21680 [Mycobacterium sp. 852013-50091_SCH5140682]|uniref:muconolactone Delta-isomerase family protein n=1 Tax=Mycobacterium sp. 852013-50091_SCH5140682 TaxID=1834109 RepID=UPI0007EB2AD5|nr:muconolactone Delta-isomerase family protein [Mycobacterium sp. 852013-50091_SCH5140682]OBC00131.1 hypothetical protein A5784_21680 [Mycobacterium sp. 852013-50091_SCH5140682]
MEYLVTMTTRIPAGILASMAGFEVAEADCARTLAERGHLIRLWHPARPLNVWNTIGLFAASDRRELDAILGATPLMDWQTHEVTALYPQIDDPVLTHIESTRSQAAEFLMTMAISAPSATPHQMIEDTRARQHRRVTELIEEGHLVRMWDLQREAGTTRIASLWGARDAADMMACVESLPAYPWMTVTTVPLAVHAHDPAASRQPIAAR